MHRAWIVVGSTLLCCACGADTEGELVFVELAAQGQGPENFTTDTGWEVELERAELAIDAIYAFAPEREPSLASRLSALLVSTAHAHGGHDTLSGRRVRAEMTRPFVLDLLSGERHGLGEVEAEAGLIDELAIDLAGADSNATAELGGAQAWVSGEARRGEDVVRFEGALELPDDDRIRRVELAIEATNLIEGASVVIGVRPDIWLKDAELDRLMASPDGGPRSITAESQAGRAWLIGARNPAAFSAHLLEEETFHD